MLYFSFYSENKDARLSNLNIKTILSIKPIFDNMFQNKKTSQ